MNDKAFTELLQDPIHFDRERCDWCGGAGIHATGVVSSRPCDQCDGSGTIPGEIDYDSWEEQLRLALAAEG